MTDHPVYLRPDTLLEPLVNQWYAWAHLVPPATAAFNVCERHVRILRSYLASPELHEAALRNPAMRGGPFMEVEGRPLERVQALLDATLARSSAQHKFVAAVRELEALLARQDGGLSLEPLYREIPAPLRGLVELHYDRHHRPGFRFIERLVYASEIAGEAQQSVRLARVSANDGRPFVFATPRLRGEDDLRVDLPFGSGALRALFEMRRTPQPLAAIAERLGLPTRLHGKFAERCMKARPRCGEAYRGAEPRIRYFGHATVLFEAAGTSVLFDPLLAQDNAAGVPRLGLHDLPDSIDYVLITHGHHDHFVVESLLQLRDRVGTLVVPANAAGTLHDPSLKLLAESLGFERVVQWTEFEAITTAFGRITALPFLGEHHDLQMQSKLCYHVECAGRSVLFAADSCNFGHGVYERVRDVAGPIDTLFLGMECVGSPLSWVYGPLLGEKPSRAGDRSRRGRGCNYDEARALVGTLGCSNVYVYAMGSEPWVQHVLDLEYSADSPPIVHAERLVAACRAGGLHAERLHGSRDILLRPRTG